MASLANMAPRVPIHGNTGLAQKKKVKIAGKIDIKTLEEHKAVTLRLLCLVIFL
jgi:hypothetical protein